MRLPDPYESEAAKGWNIVDATTFNDTQFIEADVAIIGSGAGGGTAAEILSRAGKKVVILEEGALKSSRDFDLNELDAYISLYQDGMTRMTLDGAISILQGRTVGGTTVVNWTSSFRTPPQTLEYWRTHRGIKQHTVTNMAPWFELMEKRLSIAPWTSFNANNEALRRGCEKLGINAQAIARNVKGCWNLGYCGLGCPTNAKQSMLVSTIPAALTAGATLVHGIKANHLVYEKGRIRHIECLSNSEQPCRVTIRASFVILSAGSIGTPGVLLRSGTVPDPHHTAGKRTFLHPTLFAFGRMADPVDGFHGAPQTIYTDHFQWSNGVDGVMGYKLEATPMYPAFASVIMRGFGVDHKQKMADLPYTAGFLGLLRDGFHAESQGGSVVLRPDGGPALDYPINPYILDGARRAILSMTEILFAAGAKAAHFGHYHSSIYGSWGEARKAISDMPFEPLLLRMGSAHVMGGCAMGSDPTISVVDENGKHHHTDNLYVFDGSIFPTSIGTNPQLSIYGLTAKLAHQLIGDGKNYIDIPA